jgi:hypothetical protein
MSATSVLTLLALVAASSPVAVQAASPGADEALSADAKRHYEEGTKAFNLAEFPRAVAEFKAAYNARPDPLLLYNIAQAFRLGADEAQALLFYKSFLRNMPDAPNRKEVEAKIRTLEKVVAEQQKQAEQRKDSLTPVVPVVPVLPPASAVPPPFKDSATATAPAPSMTTAPVPPAPSARSTAAPAVVAAGRTSGASPAGSRPGAVPDLNPTPPPVPAGEGPMALVPPPLSSGPTSAEEGASVGANPADAAAARPVGGGTPIYRRWWFWAGIGAVALVAIAAAGSIDHGAPSTALGLYTPTFK